MRPLSAVELLSVWEQGRIEPLVQQALILLAAACPETTLDALAQLSIGQRDAHLLTLREWTFGSHLVCLVTCPACGERLELAFDVSEIRVAAPEPPETLALDTANYQLLFRLPNSLDLVAVAASPNIAVARFKLVEHCLLKARGDGSQTVREQLPSEIVDEMVMQMAQADPQANVELALDCPVCGHRWETTFDIVSFFWSEINAWALRILREVHTLASAYGWREADILALSPARRQYYLEMVGA